MTTQDLNWTTLDFYQNDDACVVPTFSDLLEYCGGFWCPCFVVHRNYEDAGIGPKGIVYVWIIGITTVMYWIAEMYGSTFPVEAFYGTDDSGAIDYTNIKALSDPTANPAASITYVTRTVMSVSTKVCLLQQRCTLGTLLGIPTVTSLQVAPLVCCGCQCVPLFNETQVIRDNKSWLCVKEPFRACVKENV